MIMFCIECSSAVYSGQTGRPHLCLSVLRCIPTLLHVFQCHFGNVWVYPVVVHLEIIFKSVHRFHCYGNINVCIHYKGIGTEREMLVSACTCYVVVWTCTTDLNWLFADYLTPASPFLAVMYFITVMSCCFHLHFLQCSASFPYDCSFCKRRPISIIFGVQYTELMCSIMVIYLPTSLTYCCYLGK